jgi:hypothetical protein
MAIWSPVTILTFTPICRALAMVALACSRGGSNNGSTPANCHLPSSSARATPSERKPRPAKFIDSFLDGRLDLALVRRHLENDLRRSLGDKELFSVRSFDGGFGALMHRVEGLEVKYLVPLQRLVVLHAADHRQVDGVLVFRTRRECRPENHLIGEYRPR